MHHLFKGVTVEVISQGKPLKLYDDPDGDPSPRTPQRYIEAVTDAIFKVRITLSDKFSLYRLQPDDGVRLSINYDGQQLEWYKDFSTWELSQRWSKGQPAEHVFSHLSRYCNHSQQWTIGETTFGALSTRDTVDSGPSVAEVKDLGKIQVSIRRVHRTKRALPLHTPKDKIGKPIVEVSEKILKGRAIVNTVLTANHLPSSGPPPTTYNIRSMNGVEGAPLTFNILYRSKHNLQMLGCIPRTPSPEHETAATISDVASREQKVRELRAQLALLEGAGNVKAEGSVSRATVKRELEDTENAGSRKRSRNSRPIETIDLTDD